jgi:pSer/pThr/pTyr-binding forkhead associated (FHA) protein
VLVLQPRDEGTPIVVDPPDNQDVVIGRGAPDSIMLPDVDLAPYQADEHGVSRLHAALRRQENTITISDLGSSNHTYINGQRLHAHEVRCLRNRDELRLGYLVLKVRFRRKTDGR